MIEHNEYESVPNSIFKDIMGTKCYSEEEKRELLEMVEDFDEKQFAVFEYFSEDLKNIKAIHDYKFDYGRIAQCDYFELNGQEIRVMTDYEADMALENSLYDLVQCQMDSGVFSWLENYIDFKKLANDSDRGQELSSYNGCEVECSKYTPETIYIYRNN